MQKKSRQQVKKILTTESTHISNREYIAEKFNTYFVNVANEMANKIPRPLQEDNFEDKFNTETIYLTPFDSDQMKKYIMELKVNSSPGIDGINSKTLQEIEDYISPTLADIINTSVTGICPDHFKISIVTPIYKSGSKEIIENYRPISLVSNLSKIFEKAIKSRFTKFLDTEKILSDGFRKEKRTEEAIMALTNFLYKKVDGSIPVIAVFIDLAKAFDAVCHKIVLKNYLMLE